MSIFPEISSPTRRAYSTHFDEEDNVDVYGSAEDINEGDVSNILPGGGSAMTSGGGGRLVLPSLAPPALGTRNTYIERGGGGINAGTGNGGGSGERSNSPHHRSTGNKAAALVALLVTLMTSLGVTLAV